MFIGRGESRQTKKALHIYAILGNCCNRILSVCKNSYLLFKDKIPDFSPLLPFPCYLRSSIFLLNAVATHIHQHPQPHNVPTKQTSTRRLPTVIPPPPFLPNSQIRQTKNCARKASPRTHTRTAVVRSVKFYTAVPHLTTAGLHQISAHSLTQTTKTTVLSPMGTLSQKQTQFEYSSY